MFSVESGIEGGEDAYDALSLEFSFRERALYFVALLRKETCNLRHSMHLRHPVSNALESSKGALYCTNTALTFRCFYRHKETPLGEEEWSNAPRTLREMAISNEI